MNETNIIIIFGSGVIAGLYLMGLVAYYIRLLRLKNEYIASLDDKQKAKYLEMKRKISFGM